MVPQAVATAFATWSEEATREIAEGLKRLEGPLLPILHAVNDRFGYVDERAVPVIADVLNLSRAEVHGCITFYHDFRSAPAGRRSVKLCRAEACQAQGSERLHREITAVLNSDEIKKQFDSDGANIVPMTPVAFQKFFVDELAKWGKVVKEANIKPE